MGCAAGADGVSGDGMFPPGTLPAAAQQSADPPLDRETGRSAWGAEAAAALCGHGLTSQFAKWLQKVKQLCEAPELKESAELLVLLASVRRSADALHDSDAAADADADAAAADRAADVAASAAASALRVDLHPNALSPRWLAARLSELGVGLGARWAKFSDEQAVWVQVGKAQPLSPGANTRDAPFPLYMDIERAERAPRYGARLRALPLDAALAVCFNRLGCVCVWRARCACARRT